MPNDARLGLVIGVTLVILMAILFVRKDATTAVNASPANTTSVASSTQTRLSAPIPGVPGVPTNELKAKFRGGPLMHRVAEGESLMSLAVKYYGSNEYFSLLYEANRDQLRSPDRVTVGMMLRVPPRPTK
jgi:nucleoid-associated protein YgaU